jgi:hypothetical protein
MINALGAIAVTLGIAMINALEALAVILGIALLVSFYKGTK